jgi:hypothetical protein
MDGVQMNGSWIGAAGQTDSPRGVASLPAELENRVLRQAVRENLVSFPSQIPVFEKQSRTDLQPKLVVLYFVRGWSMDDIAQRYGLARQRMGQILTAWRIRAVKEGYIQAIEPEHPLFKRVRLERADQFAEMPVASFFPGRPVVAADQTKAAAPAPASPVDESREALPRVAELGASNPVEELHAIVSILDNQLRLCSQPLNASIDSCELLLVRARALCGRLEARVVVTEEERRTEVIVSAAKELFQRIQAHAAECSSGRNEARPLPAVTNKRSVPPSKNQTVAVSGGLPHGQLSRECEVVFRDRASSPTPPAP